MTDPARPLVTFALFAYNQEAYIREAVEGVFAQTYRPLEIILSDDCSSDRTFEIMQEMAGDGSAPEGVEVIVRRNPRNLGIADHFNTLIQAARGEIVVVAAGDDISLPGRTAQAATAFAGDDSLTFIECGLESFTDDGSSRIYPVHDRETRLALPDLIARPKTRLVGAGRAYRRAALLKFPPLAADCPTEDSTCVLRCLIVGDGLYLPEVMARRRVHGANVSGPGRIGIDALAAIGNQYQADIAAARSAGLLDEAGSRALSRSLGALITERKLAARGAQGASFWELARLGLTEGGFGIATLGMVAAAAGRARHHDRKP